MVKTINAAQFSSEVTQSPVALVDFFATWCGPCRMLSPVVEALSEEFAGQAEFFKLDVDEAPELAAQFRVQSIPCLVLLKNGQLAAQSVGFKPQAQLSQWIKSNL